MAKATKTVRSHSAGTLLTQPIGAQKAAKFSEVEGLKMSPATKALSQTLTANGLKGDAYRRAVAKAFKKA